MTLMHVTVLHVGSAPCKFERAILCTMPQLLLIEFYALLLKLFLMPVLECVMCLAYKFLSHHACLYDFIPSLPVDVHMCTPSSLQPQ